MESEDLAMHFVCTHEKAGELVSDRNQFWVSNCGCREGKGQCERSRMDVCLFFDEDFPPTGSGYREICRIDVDEILHEAKAKQLVSRPFRRESDSSRTAGICFCCDDCCEYFLNPEERCDKGERIESTDEEQCTHCGVCVDVCYFSVRALQNGRLVVDRDSCYGCGLCADVCPDDCIAMPHRVLE